MSIASASDPSALRVRLLVVNQVHIVNRPPTKQPTPQRTPYGVRGGGDG